MARKTETKFTPLDHQVSMLDVLFQDWIPQNNTTLNGGKQVGNLSDECLQFIIVRTWQNWKPSQIAGVLGISNHSVRSSIKMFESDAREFLYRKIVVKITSPDKRRSNRYLCRFHGEQFSKPGEAVNHSWEQLFADELF